MKEKTKKILGISIGSVFVLVIASLIIIGNYLVTFALVRTDGTSSKDVAPKSIATSDTDKIIAANTESYLAQVDEIIANRNTESLEIISDDGLKLKGDLYTIPESDTHLWAITVHGYKSSKKSMAIPASQFSLKGFNVLIPTNRAHGDSEGKYIGMGWLDKNDILKWCDLIIQRDSEAQIVLYGCSMGGATVMMCSGEKLPSNIKAIVEDCGYASVWDIFSDELKYLYHLPATPFMEVSSIISKIRAGYFFKEASAFKSVKKSTVPIFFIHGGADTFVRVENVYKVYTVCPTAKDLLIIEDAGHHQSYLLEPERYFNSVFAFLTEKCNIEF